MFAKCRYMDEITGNRGVIFATGTPVSNSMTELFTMQRYLQHQQLEEMDMIHFDCWASRFGETKTALELAPEGKGYRPRTRFSRFHNLPELMNLFKEIADIKTADQLHLPVPEVEYHMRYVIPVALRWFAWEGSCGSPKFLSTIGWTISIRSEDNDLWHLSLKEESLIQSHTM